MTPGAAVDLILALIKKHHLVLQQINVYRHCIYVTISSGNDNVHRHVEISMRELELDFADRVIADQVEKIVAKFAADPRA